MRIGITNPTTWPWVRRGGERFINELAAHMAERGHSVTLISGKPGAKQVRRDGSYTSICHRRLWHPAFAKLGFLEFHAFFPVLLRELVRQRFDAVLCCTFLDSYAAILSRKITGTPCVFWVNSPPPPVQYFRSLTLGGAVIRRAMREADEVISLSGYMHSVLERRFGRGGMILPVPVDLSQFPLKRNRSRSILLCAAALDDPRKGGTVLMKAFDSLKKKRPELLLRVAANVTEGTRERLLAILSPRFRNDVEFLTDCAADLPRLYGEASVSVLPSMWEGFGMVVVESMAAGTPVVGTRDGALPELICNSRIGRLFDPGERSSVEPTNSAGLAAAIEECLDLSQLSETALHCRRRAEELSWEVVGPAFENVFASLALRRRRCAG